MVSYTGVDPAPHSIRRLRLYTHGSFCPRADAVLEYFLEAAMEDFLIGHVDQSQWHPDYRSQRVAIFVLVKKPGKAEA